MTEEIKQSIPDEQLEREIRIVREMIELVHAQAQATDDVSELRRILVSISQASSRLANLLKVQHELERETAGNHALNQEMDRILGELAVEKGIQPAKDNRSPGDHPQGEGSASGGAKTAPARKRK